MSRFDWPIANEAELFLRERINAFLGRNNFASSLAQRMRNETATDFFEWIDHLTLEPQYESSLQQFGFIQDHEAESIGGERVYEHPFATLPRVLIDSDRAHNSARLALRVESAANFQGRHALSGTPAGEPFSPYRYLTVFIEDNAELAVVERAGYRGFVPSDPTPAELRRIIKARELWRTRRRKFIDGSTGFEIANNTLDQVLELVGPDLACHLFFEAERDYWEDRNKAARFQKWRQEQLGLGWANHDHHTFRCSREHFVDVISFLLKLGFHKRERYYAGTEAGWGAQICEQDNAGIVVFADVDLMPDEIELDFSTIRLPPCSRLGTVGLWVGLHGESFLDAGMHHLEARFDFARMEQQLKASGFNMMKPFSNFEFLRQAFTEGERWAVRPERIRKLQAAGLITEKQSEQFAKEGAIGSHLENLQRHGGFKGFNQKSVSAIIQATDPRSAETSAIAA